MIRECSKCDADATLVATKRFHTFGTKDRFYCDKCYSELERRDDIILLVSLVASLLLLAASIFLYINTRQIVKKTQNDAIQIERQARDFDNDGVVDIWEQQATDEQIKNFNTLGYPCEDIEGTETSSRALVAVIPSSKWLPIYKNNKDFKNTLNYPAVMDTFIEKFTVPSNVLQLSNILLTTNGEIAFVVKKFSKPPQKWEKQEIVEDKKPDTKEEAEEKEEQLEPKSPVPILDARVCYEQLSKREAKRVAEMLEIPADRLTAAYK